MSVAKDFRRKGSAKIMLAKLEEKTKRVGYLKLVLETNLYWINTTGRLEVINVLLQRSYCQNTRGYI
ncbi:hypothetical protein [Tuberibacillus sp. Marseille-P3662]|uniref:hypothetical protein n=1 Tax=Tuberibacillus sp. Marseille-P3662 TaxID=1965358 RepID=UPI0034E8BBDA